MINKLQALLSSTQHPVQYVIGCVKYYAGKGMSWREVVEAEYAAMVQCSRSVEWTHAQHTQSASS